MRLFDRLTFNSLTETIIWLHIIYVEVMLNYK